VSNVCNLISFYFLAWAGFSNCKATLRGSRDQLPGITVYHGPKGRAVSQCRRCEDEEDLSLVQVSEAARRLSESMLAYNKCDSESEIDFVEYRSSSLCAGRQFALPDRPQRHRPLQVVPSPHSVSERFHSHFPRSPSTVSLRPASDSFGIGCSMT
jgi:hypothetical protein